MQGLSSRTSAARINPEKLRRHAVASLRSDKEPDLSASSTIAFNISTVTGSFFLTGFVSIHLNPSKVALTKQSDSNGGRPAVECTQDTALQASSAADLDFFDPPMCCRYKGELMGLCRNWCKIVLHCPQFPPFECSKIFLNSAVGTAVKDCL